LKKETLTSKDFYIFNDYVIDRVNFYRVLYIVGITIIYKKYYIYWITTVAFIALFIFIILIVIILGASMLCTRINYSNFKLKSNNILDLIKFSTYNDKTYPKSKGQGIIALKAQAEPITALVSTIVALGGLYQVACNEAVADFHARKAAGNAWRKIIFKTPESYLVKDTVNIVQETFYKLHAKQEGYESIKKQHRQFIEKSPILRIAYKQKNCIKSWLNHPTNFFSSDTVYGSVSHVKKGNFLVLNLIRKDWDATVFMPTYYLPVDSQLDSEVKVQEALAFYEKKFNLIFPVENRPQGLIVLTQAESLNTTGLFRHWRPSLDYNEPDFLSRVTNIEEYYKLNESTNRIKKFNHQNIINKLKIHAIKSDFLKEIEHVTKNELIADKLYNYMLDYFLYRIMKESRTTRKFIICRQNPNIRESMTIKEIMANAIKKEDAKIEKLKDWNNFTPEERLRQNLIRANRLRLNNYSASVPEENRYLKFRRSYNNDTVVWTQEKDRCVYNRIDRTGFIEGFKSRGQKLGHIKSHIYVPLKNSRTSLWDTINDEYISKPHLISNLSSMYGICVTRLSFEFFEFRPISNTASYVDKDWTKGAEVYSIIDINNNNIVHSLDINIHDKIDIMLPKHDYNFFDNIDENSIRLIMDFLYCDDDYRVYRSYVHNRNIREAPKSKLLNKWYKFGLLKAADIEKKTNVDILQDKSNLTEPHLRVTQDEVDKYIKKGRGKAIRVIGDPTINPLDRDVLEGEAIELIRKQKEYEHKHNLERGERLPVYRSRAGQQPKKAIYDKLKEESRIEYERKRDIAMLEKEAIDEVGQRLEIDLTNKIQEISQESGHISNDTDLDITMEDANENVNMDDSNTNIYSTLISSEEYINLDNTEHTGLEMLNSNFDPEFLNLSDYNNESNYMSLAGIEDESLFGESGNIIGLDINDKFPSSSRKHTLDDDEDIYSAD
jgi:hypothetical protein